MAANVAADMPVQETTPNMVRLVSSEGAGFDVPRDVVRLSITINTLLQDLGMDDPDANISEPIPLQNVNSATLEKVVQWCTLHKADPPVTDDADNRKARTDVISEWDVQFLKVDQSSLFELILAANYLDIKGLLDLACKTVANMIQGKSPEETQRTFYIKDDIKPEEKVEKMHQEEKMHRKENEHCED